MSDRESMLMARLLTEENRSEAAEARVAELEEALKFYADDDIYKVPHTGWSVIGQDKGRKARTALQEPGDAKPISAADMRERAAKYVEELGPFKSLPAIAVAIRALPLTALQDSDSPNAQAD